MFPLERLVLNKKMAKFQGLSFVKNHLNKNHAIVKIKFLSVSATLTTLNAYNKTMRLTFSLHNLSSKSFEKLMV